MWRTGSQRGEIDGLNSQSRVGQQGGCPIVGGTTCQSWAVLALDVHECVVGLLQIEG